jgi:hypothetical protein
VSVPSTCGWMLAERRDFTVETYSSARGTGARLIVSTFTGNGCAAGALASVLLHPVLTKAAASATGASTVNFVNFRIARSLQPNAYQQKMPITMGKIQNLNCQVQEIREDRNCATGVCNKIGA